MIYTENISNEIFFGMGCINFDIFAANDLKSGFLSSIQQKS